MDKDKFTLIEGGKEVEQIAATPKDAPCTYTITYSNDLDSDAQEETVTGHFVVFGAYTAICEDLELKLFQPTFCVPTERVISVKRKEQEEAAS